MDAAIARIGPNAIIRAAEALRLYQGEAVTAEVFERARLARYLAALPTEMVDEREVIALHQALRATLSDQAAREVAREAGVRTADYLLAHRIPRPVQVVLRILPPGLAARILLKAIGGHAWTFCGSGAFAFEAGHPVRLTITDCPLARGTTSDTPVCDYYTATFQRLFRDLVSPRATVTETECEACGAAACVFEIRWR